MRESATPYREEVESSPRRVGLVVVHGIGEQRPGVTVRDVVDGLKQAYPDAEVQDLPHCRRPVAGGEGALYCVLKGEPYPPTGPRISEPAVSPEVRVYEAHWAPVLSGKRVRGSFEIQQPEEFVWFPLLNWLHVENFGADYPWWRVWRWTLVLMVLGAMLTAAYVAASVLLTVAHFFWRAVTPGSDGEEEVEPLVEETRESELFGPIVRALLKRRKAHGTRHWLDRYLDEYVGDVFNYINSAGGTDDAIPGVEDEVQEVFRQALALARRDGCSEVQVLAHSLGSVIVYRALTCFRAQTEEHVSLSEQVPDRPQMTRLYTIGSPLEKIRFFWPKLIPEDDPSSLHWDNFRNKGDPVAGAIGKFHIVREDRRKNHNVAGARGLLTAHTGYRLHPSFLHVFGPAVVRRTVSGLKKKWYQPGWRLSAVGQAVGVPLTLFGLAAFGVWLWHWAGWLLGLGVGMVLGSESVVAGLLTPQVLSWAVPLVLVVGALPLSFVRAWRAHRRPWRDLVMNRRSKMSNEDKTSETTSEETRAEETTSPYRKPGNYGVLLGNIAILVAIGWVGWSTGAEGRFTRPEAGLLILVLMVGFAVLSGRGITGYWRGILIDQRNKMSLSRLQLVSWTLLVLSTLLTVVLTNVSLGSESPLAIEIPSELWVLLGITTASAVGSPAVLSTKRGRRYSVTELKDTKAELARRSGAEVDMERSDTIIYNEEPEDARWGDLLKGDDVGNAATVDLGKLQMFFFTFVLVLGYGAAIAALLEGAEVITALPPVDDGMNTLLGISHTGYLASKTVSVSKQAEKPGEAEESGEAGVEE